MLTFGSAINSINSFRNLTLKFLRAATKFLRTPIANTSTMRKPAQSSNHAMRLRSQHKSMVADRMAWVSQVGEVKEVVRYVFHLQKC